MSADVEALSQPRVERMIHEVETVVRNIADGDCPCAVAAAWVFVDGSILGQEGSVRVLVNTHHAGARPTPAADLLAKLCEGEHNGLLSKAGATLADAVPAMLAAGVEQGIIEAGEVPRLTELYQTWLADVDWKETEVTMTRRPSLEDWEGWPWEFRRILEDANCGLSRGLKKRHYVQCECESEPPSQDLPEEMAEMYKPIFAEDKGAVADVRAAVLAAIESAKNEVSGG